MDLGNSKGQALVELAFALLLLVPILFGIIEFGRAMYITNTLNYAAREGARRASVAAMTPLDITALTTQVAECIPVPFETEDLNVTFTPTDPVHGVSTINVIVTLPFVSVVPNLITQLDGIILRGEASMRYE